MVRINNARNFSGVLYVTKNITDTITSLISVSGNDSVDSVGHIVEKLVGTSATSYKLNPNVIPDLAITQVYIWDASAAVMSGNSTTDAATLLDGIIGSITDAGVQRGDVVIVTADNNEGGRADFYAGSYIFISDIANKNSIAASDWKRMYVPTGMVRTINAISPDAGGNVDIYSKTSNMITIDSIALANKSWLTDGVDNADRASDLAINSSTGAINTSLFAYLKAINADLGATNATDSASAFGKIYNLSTAVGTKPGGSNLTSTVVWSAVDEVHKLITDGTDASGTIYARLNAIEQSTGTGNVAQDITNIKTDLGTLKTALEGACKVASVEKTIPNSEQGTPVAGVSVTGSGVVTVTGISGVVLAVLDHEGNYVLPDIANSAGSNTLVADFAALGNIPANYKWTIYYTDNPSVTLIA